MKGRVISEELILGEDGNRYNCKNSKILNGELKIDDDVDFEIFGGEKIDDIFIIKQEQNIKKNSSNGQNNLSENVVKKFDMLIGEFTNIYGDKNFGQIKLFGIVGSILFLVGDFFPLGIWIGFVITLIAMYRADSICKTKSFRKMLYGAFFKLLAVGIIAISIMAATNNAGVFGNNIDVRDILVGNILAAIISIGFIYFFYRSYEQLAEATGSKLFKISGALIAIGLVVNPFVEILATFLVFVGAIGLVIS